MGAWVSTQAWSGPISSLSLLLVQTQAARWKAAGPEQLTGVHMYIDIAKVRLPFSWVFQWHDHFCTLFVQRETLHNRYNMFVKLSYLYNRNRVLVKQYLYTEMAFPQQSWWYPLNLKLKYTTMAVSIFLFDFGYIMDKTIKKHSKKTQNSEIYKSTSLLVIIQLCSNGHYGSILCCKDTLWNEKNFTTHVNNTKWATLHSKVQTHWKP